MCGGVALYVKNHLITKKREDLSFHSKEISETVFVEITQQRSKNILIGCHYRHHTDLNKFNSSYLENLTES